MCSSFKEQKACICPITDLLVACWTPPPSFFLTPDPSQTSVPTAAIPLGRAGWRRTSKRGLMGKCVIPVCCVLISGDRLEDISFTRTTIRSVATQQFSSPPPPFAPLAYLSLRLREDWQPVCVGCTGREKKRFSGIIPLQQREGRKLVVAASDMRSGLNLPADQPCGGVEKATAFV